ncbi:MAG: hypothetical protein ACK5PP_16285 [Acidimicrobiales bacterium]
MTTATKLGGFAVVLTVAFLVSFGIGRAVGPVGGVATDHGGSDHTMVDQ